MRIQYFTVLSAILLGGCGTYDVTTRSEKYTTVKAGEIYRLRDVAYATNRSNTEPGQSPSLLSVSGTFEDGSSMRGRRDAIREIVHERGGRIFPVGTRFLIHKIYYETVYRWGDFVVVSAFTPPSETGELVELTHLLTNQEGMRIPTKGVLELEKTNGGKRSRANNESNSK